MRRAVIRGAMNISAPLLVHDSLQPSLVKPTRTGQKAYKSQPSPKSTLKEPWDLPIPETHAVKAPLAH